MSVDIFLVGTSAFRIVASFTSRRRAIGMARDRGISEGVVYYVYTRSTIDTTRPAAVGRLTWAPEEAPAVLETVA